MRPPFTPTCAGATRNRSASITTCITSSIASELCDEVAPLLVDRDAVELALWFHDAVYDTGASTNELRSAELFLTVSAGASFLFRHRVCDHILATRHSTTVRDPDRRFLVDIDLSGFGAPWEEFMRNGDLLREESSGQTDVKYHYGQVAFLSRLQQRRSLLRDRVFSRALRDDRARQPAPRAGGASREGLRDQGAAELVAARGCPGRSGACSLARSGARGAGQRHIAFEHGDAAFARRLRIDGARRP